MLWATVIAGGSGLLLGLWLRAPAVLAASAATVAACIVVLPFANWSLLAAILFGFGLSTALQLGYLAGLMLSCARARAGSWSGLLRSVVGTRQWLAAHPRSLEPDTKAGSPGRS